MLCDVCRSAPASLMVWAMNGQFDANGRPFAADLIFVCAPKVGAFHPCAPFDGADICSSPICADGAKFALRRFAGWSPKSAAILREMAETT